MVSTIFTAWAIMSLPVALVVARCIEPPIRRHRKTPGPVAAPAASDRTWLDDQPPEIRLTRTEVDLRLRDIEAAETWTLS
jgi:hypothetical protein